jgi:predicted 3-demethylubiquinone-9 3-methyltransferase (glyoxalase superfamily)
VQVSPFLWFDHDAEQVLAFYAGVFADSEIVSVTRMDVPSHDNGGYAIGSIRLGNLTFTVMNGGPAHALNEAFSLVVTCHDQEEVDYYWAALGDGGEPGPCGWLKDRFGLSWQITPTMLLEYLADPDPTRADRVRDAMLTMGKIECDELQAAYEGRRRGMPS